MKELGAIREVFGDHSPYLRDQSDDRPLWAPRAQETIYSLLMLEHGFIAPSINIEEMDEQAAGLNIVQTDRTSADDRDVQQLRFRRHQRHAGHA